MLPLAKKEAEKACALVAPLVRGGWHPMHVDNEIKFGIIDTTEQAVQVGEVLFMSEVKDYILDGVLTLLLSAPFYFSIRFFARKKQGVKTSPQRETAFAFFGLFIIWLASETVLPEVRLSIPFTFQQPFHLGALERIQSQIMMNFEPFKTIRGYLAFYNIGSSAVNLIGNVVMFIPLGLLLPLLWQKARRLWKMFLIGLGSSCFIEFVQLFIDRSVDVDDVILNVSGVVLGYLIIKVVFSLSPKMKNQAL